MGQHSILERIRSPFDLRYLSPAQTRQLCAEIRCFLVESVSKTGGHLASNLGVVELTVALHREFSSPVDQIVWDVGHQCYTHKLLTGRREKMGTLRQKNGLSGFPKPSESPHDPFVAGHASTSLSVADGIARAKSLRGEPGQVIAVIGDGALTGGPAFEGLNNIARGPGRVIVVLNDNKMSISKNVGGLTRYLTRLRTAGGYYRLKDLTKQAMRSIPGVGEGMADLASQSLAQLKSFVYTNASFFEEMGFAYMGPVDGHDLRALEDALERAKTIEKPVLLHVETVKGKGFALAEKNPGAFHGVSTFNPAEKTEPQVSEDSYSCAFGKHLTRLAVGDERICAVTAAMKYGTGLHYFKRRLGRTGRFFDVGIAEGHGVTFSAALASKGMLPVFAVYSSFLQRGYDQLLHDCAIQKQHVVLAVDRAGLVGEDGETHQGIFDCAFLSGVPGSVIYSPWGYRELENCLDRAVREETGLCAVRYPRGAAGQIDPRFTPSFGNYHHLDAGDQDLLLVTYGRLYEQVCAAVPAIERDHPVSLLKLTRVWPLDPEALRIVAGYRRVVFLEEGIRRGGVGEHMLSELLCGGYKGEATLRAIDGCFPPPGTVAEQLAMTGLDAASIVQLVDQLDMERKSS